MVRFLLFICVSVSLLFSCATYKGQVTQHDITAIAAKGTTGLVFGTYNRNFSELVRTPAARLIVIASTGHTYDLYIKMPEKHKDDVFLFELPAGSYMVERILYELNQPGKYYVKTYNLPLTVKANMISYLGTVSFQTGSVPAALHTEITQNFVKDKEILEKRYTQLTQFTYMQ